MASPLMMPKSVLLTVLYCCCFQINTALKLKNDIKIHFLTKGKLLLLLYGQNKGDGENLVLCIRSRPAGAKGMRMLTAKADVLNV